MNCDICHSAHKNCVCVGRASLRETLRGIPTPSLGTQAIKTAKQQQRPLLSSGAYSFVLARRRESKAWRDLLNSLPE